MSDVAEENPFTTKYFVWIDAGIANPDHKMHANYFSKPWLEERLSPHLEKFLFLCFKYEGNGEIHEHGFKREGIQKYCNVDYVSRMVRGAFFGGKATECKFLSEKFREIAHKSLDEGYMGADESLFTILTYLYP